ncbi:MAG: arylesterase [Bacteroidota bacterium]
MSITSLLLLAWACGSDTSDTPSASDSPTVKQEAKATEDKGSDQKTILFFGNSLTAAYGLNPEEGFTALIQNRIDSLELAYQVVNSGSSGETTAGGFARIDWVLAQQPFDIFVLELGGNDALRGTPTEEAYKNLKGIIKKVKTERPGVKVVLAGMEAPPNLGGEYTSAFRQVYRRLATEEEASLIPFLLDGVGGVRELNQEDGIHPTAAGHRLLADNIWVVLSKIL